MKATNPTMSTALTRCGARIGPMYRSSPRERLTIDRATE